MKNGGLIKKNEQIVDKPVVDASLLTDKWSRESIDNFNKFMISVRDLLTRNEEIKSSVKNGFRDLKLLNAKLSKSQKGDMACVFINMETRAVFEFYNISGNIEIVDYESAFQYKEMVQKRLDAAQQMEKDEKEDYLNRYCHVDFNLLDDICGVQNDRPRTKMILRNEICINSGESKTFSDKIINLTNDIKCKGELNFVNCEIWYHKKHEGQIRIDRGAELSFEGCVIRCFGCNEKRPLFDCIETYKQYPTISFINSEFYDCSDFIVHSGLRDISFRECKFYNCVKLVTYLSLEDSCVLTDCYFEINKIAGFYCKNKQYLDERFFVLITGNFYLENLTVCGNPEIISKITFAHDYNNENWSFSVKNCQFDNVKECIENARVIENCKFFNCITAIQKSNFFDNEKGIKITNCLFDKCESNLLLLDVKDGLIDNCLFKHIQIEAETTILLKSLGDYHISNCTFENVSTAVNDEEDNLCFFKPPALIKFDNLDRCRNKILLYLEKCKFINCKGHLVELTKDWYKMGIFSDDDGTETVVSISKCKGIGQDGVCK